VHGALIALDESFDANSFALTLQIPTQNTQVSAVLVSTCVYVKLIKACRETFPMLYFAGETSARNGILESAGDGDREAAGREQYEILIQFVE